MKNLLNKQKKYKINNKIIKYYIIKNIKLKIIINKKIKINKNNWNLLIKQIIILAQNLVNKKINKNNM